jgi:glycosidase
MVWDEAQQNRDLWQFYRATIQLRRSNAALTHGRFQETQVDSQVGLYAYRRWTSQQQIEVFLNNGDRATRVVVGPGRLDLLHGRTQASSTLELPPRSGAVLEVCSGHGHTAATIATG